MSIELGKQKSERRSLYHGVAIKAHGRDLAWRCRRVAN
jgi:hypothetical protein